MAKYKLKLNLSDGTNVTTTNAIDIPTKTSELTNNSGFITTSSLSNYLTTNTEQDVTAKKTFKTTGTSSTSTLKAGAGAYGGGFDFMSSDAGSAGNMTGNFNSSSSSYPTISNIKSITFHQGNASQHSYDTYTTTLISGAQPGSNLTITLPYSSGTVALNETIPANQATIAVVGGPITNINGRNLSSYTATLTESTYTYYTITYGSTKCTEVQAKNYMEYMTGSRFLPSYNYDYPKNTIFMFADRSLWKPQYDDTNGLLLYRLSTPLALESDLPQVIDLRS